MMLLSIHNYTICARSLQEYKTGCKFPFKFTLCVALNDLERGEFFNIKII